MKGKQIMETIRPRVRVAGILIENDEILLKKFFKEFQINHIEEFKKGQIDNCPYKIID